MLRNKSISMSSPESQNSKLELLNLIEKLLKIPRSKDMQWISSLSSTMQLACEMGLIMDTDLKEEIKKITNKMSDKKNPDRDIKRIREIAEELLEVIKNNNL